MKEIPLTKGQVAIVDDEDYEGLNKYKWHASWNESARTFYARRATGVNGKQEYIYMHREIMGAGKAQRVGHRDFDGLHNWRENLQLCTYAQSRHYQRKRRDSAYPYKGIGCTASGSFWARIAIGGVPVSLGVFKSAEDAARAYDEAAVHHYGRFAITNFDEIVVGAMANRNTNRESCRIAAMKARGRKCRRNKSGYVGVSWQKDIKQYTAKIGVDGKRVYIGSFRDRLTAALAYDAVARQHYGELANVNFPIDQGITT